MEMNQTIRLLVEAFDAHKLNYQVFETDQYQEIRVPFGVRNGPFVDVRYISAGHRNDLLIRIVNLVNKVPEQKHARILETCNTLNHKYRFLKFTMDPNDDVHVEYDLPASTGADCVGEMAFEIFVRTMQILNECYIFIAQALYAADEPASNGKIDPGGAKDLLQLLKENHDEINIKISKADPSDPQDI